MHRLFMPTSQARALRAILVALALLLVTAASAAAQTTSSVDRAFTQRYSANEPGNIAIAANTVMSCPTGSGGCTTARNTPASNTTDNPFIDNDNFAQTFVATGDFDSNFNSSTSNLTLPAGAEVLFAGLYWGGTIATGPTPAGLTRTDVKFKEPGAAAYEHVTALQLDTLSDATFAGFYQSFADVTTQVQSAGPGKYQVANIDASTGMKGFAGWSLVVAYRDTTQPLHNITIFDGYRSVNATQSTTIPVSGFRTPASGAVNTDLGFLAWEGDRGLVGDKASLSDTTAGHTNTPQTLSDASNPATNFFNSSISKHGVEVGGSDRNPNYSHTMGIDADIFDASGKLGNNATSASIGLSTSGDVYAPGMVAFATQLYAPDINQVKTVTDVNGGAVEPGDTLTYDISATNDGQDDASGLTVTDDIPANTTYVPGSAEVVSPAAGQTASYDSGIQRTTFDLGTITASTGSYHVRFSVTVDGAAANGTVINNTATANFTGATLGHADSASSSASATVAFQPNLTIAKTHAGVIRPGADVSYTLDASNVGGADTTGTTTVTDTPGAGLTAQSISGTGWTCDLGTLTCTRSDALGPAAHYPPITVVAHVDATRTANVTNDATVAGDAAPHLGDNSAEDTSAVVPTADLAVHKELLTANPTVGGPVRWRATVTNNGPSSASGIVVTDTTTGAHGVHASVDGGAACTASGGGLSCPVGALGSGQSAVVTVDGTLDSATSTVSNTASADGDQDDPTASNDSDTVTSPVATSADLSLTKTADTDIVQPGGTITYTIVVHNGGPGVAFNTRITDTLPEGTSLSDGPGCTNVGRVVTCPLGDLPSGADVTRVLRVAVGPTTSGKVVNIATVSSDTPDGNTANNSNDPNSADVTVPATPEDPPPPPPCTDKAKPVTTLVRKGVRGTGPVHLAAKAGLTLKGTSTDPGDCVSGLSKVQVSLARVAGRTGVNCRFLKKPNKYVLTKPQNCRKPVLFTAKGTGNWTFTFPVKLKPGKYRAQARGVDLKNNKETPKKGQSIVYFTVR